MAFTDNPTGIGTDELARRLGNRRPPVIPRQGKVTATPGGGVVTVQLPGSDPVDMAYLAAYTPAINDTVWVLEMIPDYLVLGKQAV